VDDDKLRDIIDEELDDDDVLLLLEVAVVVYVLFVVADVEVQLVEHVEQLERDERGDEKLFNNLLPLLKIVPLLIC